MPLGWNSVFCCGVGWVEGKPMGRSGQILIHPSKQSIATSGCLILCYLFNCCRSECPIEVAAAQPRVRENKSHCWSCTGSTSWIHRIQIRSTSWIIPVQDWDSTWDFTLNLSSIIWAHPCQLSLSQWEIYFLLKSRSNESCLHYVLLDCCSVVNLITWHFAFENSCNVSHIYITVYKM